MDFKDLQNKVIQTALNYSKKYKIKIDDDFALLKLYEELGEFTKSFIIHKRKCRPKKYITKKDSKKELAKELADVIGVAIVLAYLLDINLEKWIEKKWIEKK